jgi:RHS repeat-associated protein
VDTEFYYLQSRYYDPETCRFLNADSQLNPGTGLIGYNMFAYCNNNPVNMADPDGHLPFFVITGLIGAVAGAVVGAVTTGTVKGALIGAAAGALIGVGAGAAAGAMLAGSVTATTSMVMAGGAGLVSTVSAGGLGAGATYIANNIAQAAEKAAPAVQAGVSKASNTYYQITSKAGAAQIAETQALKPIESSYNYVLNFQPTLEQVLNTAARSIETVVRFSTNYTGFVRDATCAVQGALVANTPGVIKVFEVVEVGFK